MTLLNLTYSILILGLTILGDFLLKKAANMDGLTGWKFLLASASIYFVSAIGWFIIYKKTKFITLGTFFSIGIFLSSETFQVFETWKVWRAAR